MVTRFFFCTVFSLLTAFSNAQLTSNAQKTFGGNSYDYSGSILYNSDSSNIFLVGTSNSTIGTGDRNSIGYGFADTWVIKLDLSYNIVWEKSYGGSSTDGAPVSALLINDTIYVADASNSPISGVKTVDTLGFGTDIWMFALDLDGNILWQKVYGGTNLESNPNLLGLRNGNILMYCESSSDASGNKTEAKPGFYSEGWMVEIDKQGNIIRQKSVKQTSSNWINSIKQNPTNGNLYVLAFTMDWTTMTGDRTDPGFGGDQDSWVLEYDENLNKIKDKCFGGTAYDDFDDLLVINDGILFLGTSNSPISGNKTAPQQASDVTYGDAWLVKTDFNLNVLWDKSYGGSSGDAGFVLRKGKQGNYILLCNSGSPADGNKTSPSFSLTSPATSLDMWLIVTDAAGTILEQNSFGGNQSEEYLDFIQSPTNDLVVLCSSDSPVSGNKTAPNKGDYDMWLIEIEATTILEVKSIVSEKSFKAYPNPFENQVIFSSENLASTASLEIYSPEGKLVFEQTFQPNEKIIWETSDPSSFYMYTIKTENFVSKGKIVKL